MRKKSKRFYVVCVWGGEDVMLNAEGRVAFDGERRFVTRKVADGMCSELREKNIHAIGHGYLDGYEVRECHIQEFGKVR